MTTVPRILPLLALICLIPAAGPSLAAPPAAAQPCSVNVALLMDAAAGTLTTTGTTVNCATPVPAPVSSPLVLDYDQQTTLFDGANLATQTWATWLPAQTFTTTGGTALFILRQNAIIYTGNQEHAIVMFRLNIDNGAKLEMIGGVLQNQGASWPAQGDQGGSVAVPGLPAGPHTVSVQYFSVYPTDAPAHSPTRAWLRKVDPGGAPWIPNGPTEFLRLQVVEL